MLGETPVKALVCAATLACGVLAAAPIGQSAPYLTPCAVPGVEAARCGTVDVAEDAGTSGGRTIPVRVVVVPARRTPALPDPILFLAGGPGQGAAQLVGLLAARAPGLRETRDLLFVDQRGTGGSHPLTCPQAQLASDLMGRLFDRERLVACRDELAKRADLRHYTTAAAAADHEAVLNALNYKQVNVWGLSYGSRLGLELARRMPARVRTLVLDGAVAPSFMWPTYGARDADAALAALIADCEADTSCRSAHPTFRRDVDAAFTALAKGPANTTVTDPATRTTLRVTFAVSDLAYATRGLLYGAEALHLPRMFRAAASGRFDALAQAYVTRARGIGQGIATGVHLGVYCAEDLPFVDMAAARRLSSRTRLGTYLLDEYAAACKVWPRGAVPAGYRDPIRSDVPALIMAGRRDPVTPPWSAEAVARTLTRARVLTWEAGGHGFDGLVSPACKNAIVEDFVASARTDRIATGCMSRERKVPFVTSPSR